jgi:hypothetical protein
LFLEEGFSLINIKTIITRKAHTHKISYPREKSVRQHLRKPPHEQRRSKKKNAQAFSIGS